MKKLYLDIETLPASEESHQKLKFLYNKSKKKETEDFEEFLLHTTFDGAFGRILCIGYAFDDEPTQVLYEGGDERKMLEKFWQMAREADLFIGHNVIDFDMRFIYQRSIIKGVRPSKELSFARYRSSPMYDTMREWAKWSFGPSIGLERLALAMDIPTPKKGIDGSQVFNFYKKGKVKEILDYCQRDVETTRAVYKKMIFN